MQGIWGLVYGVQLAQVASNQLGDGLGGRLGIVGIDVRAHDGQPSQKIATVDEDCGLDHSEDVLGVIKKKPQGLGLAYDRQPCHQDGSEAYCQGADDGVRYSIIVKNVK